ncbi:MAG TPA: BTAD domain-containing putative transcriptional regulator, partial [Solirubrobacterales bacterium]|nr:BTAD domain-containing putative transcriptional regulator [Solirubrobacterales bacterium]
EPVALAGKQRELLAILLLHANEVVASDTLIDGLWGESAPETAPKALQVHVSQLRKQLEPERDAGDPARLLVTRPPGYAIVLGPGQLDLERFEQLAGEGREALAAGDPARASERLAAALELWRGSPLADLAFASFAQPELVRLEQIRVGALEDRIAADLECGRDAELVPELEGLVASEPLRERLWEQLMLALYRCGRQAEALEAYRRGRRILVDELGIEPGKRMTGLHEAILNQDPELDPPARRAAERPPEPAASPPASATPEDGFVGRVEELELLDGALDGAFDGRGSIQLIGGEPGIGKSRLAEQLSRRALARGARVFSGRCWEAGGAPAFWPWVQALRAYVREADVDELRTQLGPHGGEVAHILPEVRELFPDLPVLESPDSEGARFRLFDATCEFIREAAAERPLVLVLEDLHAADVPSLLLLQFLAGEIGNARLLTLGTYRDIEVGPDHPLSSAITQLTRHSATRTLSLKGFGAPDVSSLFEAIAGVPPSPRVAAAIHAGTGGNPLFVAELVRLLAAEGRLDAPIDETDVRKSIPRGVRDVITRRLSRLPAGTREALEVASVLGREFEVETLAQAIDRAPGEVIALLDQAVDEGVIAEVPGSSQRLRFGHVLIRDTLYQQLSAARRQRLHRDLGELLERRYAADPDPHLAELAQHFSSAGVEGDPSRAFDYARRAGDRAVRLLAHEEAARLYALALRVLDGTPGDQRVRRCETLVALGNSHLRAGDQPLAKTVFLEAAGVARELEAPELFARAALGYGGLMVWTAARGDPHLVGLLEEALSRLDNGDSELRARLSTRLSCAIRDQPDRGRIVALSDEAVEMARRMGDPATLAYALDARCIALAGPGTVDEFTAAARELSSVAAQTGDTRLTMMARFYRTFSELQVGELNEAMNEVEQARREADDLREPSFRWAPTALIASLNLLRGRFEDAERMSVRAYEYGRQAQPVNALAARRLQRFLLRRELGGLEEEEPVLRRWSAGDPTFPVGRCALASLYSHLGRRSEAAAILDELAPDEFAAIHLDEEWLVALALLAEVCQILGESDHARVLYGQLEPFADRNAIAWPEGATGACAHPLGVLAATLGMREVAIAHFEDAIAMNDRMGARPWSAHSRFELGRLLCGGGDPASVERGRELLEAARTEFELLGMVPWQKRGG